jgi:small subunit ribosomal protein S5
MEDIIKKVEQPVNDGFVPISTGEDSDAKHSENIKGQGKFGPRQKGAGFKRGKFGGGFNRAVKPKDDIQTKLLDLARVTRVTGGGKRLRFRAVVIAGDKKGKIGIGIDKGRDVSQAVDKATRMARKNLVSIVIINDTIPHEVEAKVGPSVILLKPQMKGRGLVAGGAVRMICDLAGIKNVSSKILSGSKNKLNNARATMEALRKLKAK